MKIKIYGKLFEFADEDVQIIDDERVTPDDFADIVAIRREQHKHEVKDGEGAVWR